jgi:amino acid permease
LASVFGSAIADKFTMGPSDEYKVAILIFMDIAIPLSLFPLTDQFILQMIFLGARMTMVVLMLVTILGAYFASEPHFGNYEGDSAKNVTRVDFSAVILMLQVCVFSTAFQFSVPGMASVSSNKKSMLSIFSSAVSCIYFTTVVLSLVMATYFGDTVQESSNLNWLNYHGGTCHVSPGVEKCETNRAWWARGISSYIVLFAALDGLAVFPFLAISLAEILMGAFYEDKVHEKQKDWKIRCAFRLLASLPQVVGAIFLKDLGVM